MGEKPPKEVVDEVKGHFDKFGVDVFTRSYFKDTVLKNKMNDRFRIFTIFLFIFSFSFLFILFIFNIHLENWINIYVPLILFLCFIIFGYTEGRFDSEFTPQVRFPWKTFEFLYYLVFVYFQTAFFWVIQNKISTETIIKGTIFPLVGILYGYSIATIVNQLFIPSKFIGNLNEITPIVLKHNKRKIDDIESIIIQQIRTLLETEISFIKSFENTNVYRLGEQMELFFSKKENFFGICILRRTGRYLVCDKENKELNDIQNNIQLILKDSLKFDDLNDKNGTSIDINNELVDVIKKYTKPSERTEFVYKNWQIGVPIIISPFALFILYRYRNYITAEHVITFLIALITVILTLYVERRGRQS